MQTKKVNTANGNAGHKALCVLLVLGICSALIGCSVDPIPAGKDSTGPRSGPWTGGSDDGAFMIKFGVVPEAAKITLIPYSYPCGDQQLFVASGQDPVKTELNNGAFDATIDYSSFSPKLTIAGKFIDRTHAEGTWHVFAYQMPYSDVHCPEAFGTWKASPD